MFHPCHWNEPELRIQSFGWDVLLVHRENNGHPAIVDDSLYQRAAYTPPLRLRKNSYTKDVYELRSPTCNQVPIIRMDKSHTVSQFEKYGSLIQAILWKQLGFQRCDEFNVVFGS